MRPGHCGVALGTPPTIPHHHESMGLGPTGIPMIKFRVIVLLGDVVDPKSLYENTVYDGFNREAAGHNFERLEAIYGVGLVGWHEYRIRDQ